MFVTLQTFSKTYTSKSNEISITINNFRANPATVLSHEDVSLYFYYTFSLTTNAESRWFKTNDSIIIETNFDNLLINDSLEATLIYDNSGTLLGKVVFIDNKMIYIVSSECEEQHYASLFGEIHTKKNYSAPYVTTSTNYTLKIENQTTTLTVNTLPVQLKVTSTGLGVTTWSSTSSINSTIVLSENESITITATPNVDTNLHFINLGLANGESISLWDTKTKDAQTVIISYSDLLPGVNTVKVRYSDRAIEFVTGNWGQVDSRTIFLKDVWGIDNIGGLPSANNDIYINENTIGQLYNSCGTNVNENNLITNVFFEDSIPGNEEVSLYGGVFSIFAVLPWYEVADNGCYKAFNPERGRLGNHSSRTGAAGQTNLITEGLLTKIQQTSTDTKESFRERVKNTPLSYGVYNDPETFSIFLYANLGSPGDPNGPGFKCTDLWPSVMASDPVLNQINGNTNCVKGKVQYFRIRFYAQYRNKYTTCYKNSAYLSYNYATKEGGVDRLKASDNFFAGSSYCISKNPFQYGRGLKYSITIENVDALDYNTPIANSMFKLQKFNGTEFVDDVTFPATDAQGITKLEYLTPNQKYRIVQNNVPSPYSLDLGTNYSTINGSISAVSSTGEFYIKDTDTCGVLALATNKIAARLSYNSNGGVGDMTANTVIIAKNSSTIVAKPLYTFSGFTFDSWNTAANGMGTKYLPNQPIILTQEETTLYAQWVPTVTNIYFGKKILEGNALQGYDYSFEITPLKDDNGTLVKDDIASTMTIQNIVNGNLYVSSSSLTAGTWYHIKEIAGTNSDIKYDTTSYLIQYKTDRTVDYYKSSVNGMIYEKGSKTDGNLVIFKNRYLSVLPECTQTTDYDGNVYESVRIGKYCWFTSNLSSTKYSDGREIANVMKYQSNLYPNVDENTDIHGFLYDWYAAIDTSKNSISPTTQVQGVCPAGWFLPTEEQFADLYNNDVITLNSPNYWINNAGTNETGFNALPSGRYNAQTGRYEDLGAECWFLSCAPKGISSSNSGNISYYCQMMRIVSTPLADGYSVRCVRE